MPDLGSLTGQVGLPIALTIYFIWQYREVQKEHKADLKDIALKATQALDKSADALEQSTVTIKENGDIIRQIRSKQ